MYDKRQLVQLDHDHVWHPFTPMTLWRSREPLLIERGEGEYLIDMDGNRYIDGVSSLWCNVHGHCVPEIDRAVIEQLGRISHTTLLGLASVPSIELASRLAGMTPRGLNKVFYSDSGATAVELSLKMAVGYWYHRGRPGKKGFIAFRGAYHGDTTGSMSVGYCELFHSPFSTMVFPVHWVSSPDALRGSNSGRHRHEPGGPWPSENPKCFDHERCLDELKSVLEADHEAIAGIIIEPLMQGAAGMMCQPPGFLSGVKELACRYDVLLIADEVATGFGRTGAMFACDHEGVSPDIMCLAKGLSGGYLPLAATLATDAIEQSFAGPVELRRTLYHGHTYTGNALACAAANASLARFESTGLMEHIRMSTERLARGLDPLRECPHVVDIRQRGIMAGIEICRDRVEALPFDFSACTGSRLCEAMRAKGLVVRPLGDVIILMPIPAMCLTSLETMTGIVVDTIMSWRF